MPAKSNAVPPRPPAKRPHRQQTGASLERAAAWALALQVESGSELAREIAALRRVLG